MTTPLRPVPSPPPSRAPLGTGAPDQKARYDALALVLSARREFTTDEVIDLCEYVLAGPEEVD